MEPAASDIITRSANGMSPGNRKKFVPFHSSMNWTHHCKSDRNSTLRRMGWSGWRKTQRRLIIRRKKVRPGQTTCHAWCSFPSSSSSCVRVHHRFCCHSLRSCLRASNLTLGRRAIWRMESNSIPKTIKQVAGPSVLSGCKGMPMQTATNGGGHRQIMRTLREMRWTGCNVVVEVVHKVGDCVVITQNPFCRIRNGIENEWR